MLVERKLFMPHQVCDICRVARDEVIQADDLMAFGEKAVAKV